MKTTYMRALPKAWSGISKVFTALGDEQRQRILLLFDRGEALNVGQIHSACPLSQPTVSHHLKILREAGVLVSERRGREVYYRVDRDRLTRALTNVTRYIEEQS